MNWRDKIEIHLGLMGEKITKHPIKIILLMLTISIALISNLPKITIDTSTEGFLYDNDPALIKYEAFKEQFGQDEKIMVVVRVKNIFTMKSLEQLQALHQELQNKIPHLNDINSLINARNTRGEGDLLIVEDLFEDFPKDEQELKLKEEIAMKSVMYKNLLLSEDATLATIMLEPNTYESSNKDDALAGFGESEEDVELEFLKDSSKSEMVIAAEEIAKEFSTPDFDVFIAGSLAINDLNKRAVQKDMQKFVKLVLLMIMIFLFVVFRRLSGVILPIIIVALSLFSTMGLMALVGTPITIPTQILPSFLLAVGIGAVVHLLAMFFKHYNENEDKNKAISYSLGHSGLAIIMTSLTTAAGLLSFSTASIAPVGDLGIFAAIGVLIALLNTIVTLPAILSVLPIKVAKEKHIKNSIKMDALLTKIAHLSVDYAKPILGISLIIIAVSIYGASKIEFKHDSLSWQPDDSAIKISTDIVNKELRGSVTMEVIVDTKKENGLYNSELITNIDTLVRKAEAIQNDKYFVGKGWSVAEVLKEIHRALHKNKEEYYAITDNDALIPQEFLLFENSGSDDLEDVVDASFSKARITFKLPWMEAGQYETLSNELTTLMENELGSDVEITITGMVPLFQRTLTAAMASMATSYITAFALIAIMMMILLGSFKMGLVSMLPNILPVLATLGFMYATNIPLDMFTMLVGAIVIGLSVDDTVHFFHNYARYHNQGFSPRESIIKTMTGTGRALVATSVVLSLGFFVYAFATLSNLINFGILAGGSIALALISNILLGPALLSLITKDKSQQKDKN
nr:efflux RND transporter permease subunit [uncultured Sulfurimonas sp.]